MRVTIIADDSKVGVDGKFRVVDLTGLEPTIHAVQWDSVRGKGDVEYRQPRRNEKITDFSYQVFVDRWNAAAPPPPPPDEPPGPSPDDELDVALAKVQAGLPSLSTIAGLKAALNDTIDAMRDRTGRSGTA